MSQTRPNVFDALQETKNNICKTPTFGLSGASPIDSILLRSLDHGLQVFQFRFIGHCAGTQDIPATFARDFYEVSARPL